LNVLLAQIIFRVIKTKANNAKNSTTAEKKNTKKVTCI
jgi:hypothetical protein